jgi:hypothetical protein
MRAVCVCEKVFMRIVCFQKECVCKRKALIIGGRSALKRKVCIKVLSSEF